MLGDMFNTNRRRDVVTREGQRMYRGKKYTEEKETGYMVCTSGSRRRLHDVLWENENIDGIETVPEGCVIHHIDRNKSNNSINNLTCITVFGHNLIHNPPKTTETKRYAVKIVPGGISEVIDFNDLTNQE